MQLRDFRWVRKCLPHYATILVANAVLKVGWTTVIHFSEISQRFNQGPWWCSGNTLPATSVVGGLNSIPYVGKMVFSYL